MGSLASRILGREVLTLQEFAHEVVTRLSWEFPEAHVTQVRPDVVAIAHGEGRRIELDIQTSYRAYQKDTRAKDQAIARFIQSVAIRLKQRASQAAFPIR